MTTDQIIGTFGIVLGSNILTAMAIYGMVHVARAEREERETGMKVPVPTYIYVAILGPMGFAIACLYYIS